jgi:hypothetical protein
MLFQNPVFPPRNPGISVVAFLHVKERFAQVLIFARQKCLAARRTCLPAQSPVFGEPLQVARRVSRIECSNFFVGNRVPEMCRMKESRNP